MEFGQKTFNELVNDYADAVYSSMLSGLDANRNWLTKADFLLVVDAGVKGHFPFELLDGAPAAVGKNNLAGRGDPGRFLFV